MRTLRAQSFHVAEPRAGFADKKALLKQWKYTGFVLASISDKSKPRRSHGYAPGPGGPDTRRDVTPLNAPGDHRAPGPPRPGTAPPGKADVRTREGPLPEAGLAPPGADPAHPQRQAQHAAQGRGYSQDLPALNGETALVRRYGTSHPAGGYRPARHRCPGPGKARPARRWCSPPP